MRKHKKYNINKHTTIRQSNIYKDYFIIYAQYPYTDKGEDKIYITEEFKNVLFFF